MDRFLSNWYQSHFGLGGMTKTRMDARMDSVEAHLTSLQETISSQAHLMANLT